MSNPTTILFLIDPYQSLNQKKDSSIALMDAALSQNTTVYICEKHNISVNTNTLQCQVQQLTQKNKKITMGEKKTITQKDIDICFIRLDPPLDNTYLTHLWLLNQFKNKILLINDPSGIQIAQEKLWSLQFKNIIPETLVTQNSEECNKFLNKYDTCILKPIHGYGGQGIFKISKKDPNTQVILETQSKNYQTPIILQPFLKESTKGDKRIILLNGEPIGCVNRVQTTDHRNNFFAGGTAHKTDLTQNDQKIIKSIKKEIKKLGLYFVGIDIIGSHLIEINVTSPTCLREINQLENNNCHQQIIKWAINKKLAK